jgi:creatinine amidohydrolase
MSKWLKTDREDLFFEDTSVGRLKKKIWEASDDEISNILDDYSVPSPSELAKPGSWPSYRDRPGHVYGYTNTRRCS